MYSMGDRLSGREEVPYGGDKNILSLDLTRAYNCLASMLSNTRAGVLVRSVKVASCLGCFSWGKLSRVRI